ncbi:MAG: methionine gamma-lyase family protein [Firmicutes bacterium]|nr:methionine gamma-lyase family protein [Bacillota bacterium]MDY3658916.1 methionine gamma-lyase family protein [Eubacteriales bacterium]
MKTDIKKCEKKLEKTFERLEQIALFNQQKVLKAFQENKVSANHFYGTSGYGYDDQGREVLGKVFASAFGAETAIVSPNITCGSHALTIALFGILRPGDVMLSVTGKPYDTLDDTIFGTEEDTGSLKDFGVIYQQVDFKNDKLDYAEIEKQIKKLKPKMVYIQRSRGYAWRSALSISDIEKIVKIAKKESPKSFVVVDNCYGEFVEKYEPTEVGTDLIVGSLIKNPGGGLASTGAYLAGTKKAVDLVSTRLTSPSLKTEVGSYERGYREFFQGFFLAPHVVKEAIKGCYLIGEVMKAKGAEILPASNEDAGDIIKSIKFNSADAMVSFVQKIQKFSPVDSYVVPMPWDMPGYNDPVIMAAGTFVAGASIELSCDGPVKPPFIAYFQGGLTYEQIKLLAQELLEEN